MPSGATAHRRLAKHAALLDRRVVASVLLGGSVAAAGFAALAIARAVPADATPRAGSVWGLLSVVSMAIGAALWLVPSTHPPRPRVRRSRAFLAAGAGLALTLLLTLVVHPDHWRSIAGHPDNAPAKFYRSTSVSTMLDRLTGYAGDRPVLGIYLSNQYECSIFVPLQHGPAGNTGAEIISVLPGGAKQAVQTKLSGDLATAEGLDVTDVKPAVIAAIVAAIIDERSLSDRDEVRVQIQRRGGATTYDIMTRKDGTDQPWQHYDLDGNRLP